MLHLKCSTTFAPRLLFSIYYHKMSYLRFFPTLLSCRILRLNLMMMHMVSCRGKPNPQWACLLSRFSRIQLVNEKVQFQKVFYSSYLPIVLINWKEILYFHRLDDGINQVLNFDFSNLLHFNWGIFSNPSFLCIAS